MAASNNVFALFSLPWPSQDQNPLLHAQDSPRKILNPEGAETSWPPS